jgi:hypothetical protein
MTRRLVVALVVSMLAGCIHATVQSEHVTSQMNFDPAGRHAAWGRALTSFQAVGAFVQIIDPGSRLLRSDTQSSWVKCSDAYQRSNSPSGTVCPARQVIQLTLTDEGGAFLRINRGVSGTVRGDDSLLTPADKQALQSECDTMLEFIVGKSKTQPKVSSEPDVLWTF